MRRLVPGDADAAPGRATAGPPEPIDEMDGRIIGLLQQDGRMPYREIARQLGVSEGTVRGRANRLISSGALAVVAIPDPGHLGQVFAFTLVQVAPGSLPAVIEELHSWAEVTYVSSCTGRADLYIQVVCRDHEHLWRLLNQRLAGVEGVTSSETFVELMIHKFAYTFSVD